MLSRTLQYVLVCRAVSIIIQKMFSSFLLQECQVHQVCRVLLMSTNRNFGLESKMALFSAVLLPAAVLRAAVEWLKMAS